MTWKEAVIEEGVHRRSHYHYNKNGWLIWKEEIEGNGGVKEGYGYTPSGQISRAVDGKGQEVKYRYNSLGKVREWIDQKEGRKLSGTTQKGT